jgi:hypothetical protein
MLLSLLMLLPGPAAAAVTAPCDPKLKLDGNDPIPVADYTAMPKGGPNAGGGKTSRPKLYHARRAAQALDLRLAGHTYVQIGARLGVTKGRAWQLVAGELERINANRTESAAALAKTEVARLDKLHEALWPQALAGDLAAGDRVLSIAARRAKLLGLDAPAKVVHAGDAAAPVQVTHDHVVEVRPLSQEQWAERVRQLLAQAAQRADHPLLIEHNPGNGTH